MRPAPSSPASTLAERSASLAGGVLSAATRTLGRARSSTKPLHPAGDVLLGRLRRSGATEPSGVPWLDEPGDDEVMVRLSRAIGLPGPVPDIHGLALRVPVDDHHADVLFAGTGLGPLSRFLLLPGRDAQARAMSTLLPYRSARGALFLAARPANPGPSDDVDTATFTLLWSRGLGPWVEFARLELSETAGPDPAVSFDPVANPLPELPPYGWVRRLRAPAYRAARDQSGRSPAP